MRVRGNEFSDRTNQVLFNYGLINKSVDIWRKTPSSFRKNCVTLARGGTICDETEFAMNSIHSKNDFVYQQVRRSLQSGRYTPGQRVDPGRVANEFKISPTPVRFALYRLVGEGLLADHARNGFHVPLPNEVVLRDLYDWMERLLLMACRMVSDTEQISATSPPEAASEDLVKQTWKLFDTIARATGHRSLHQAVKCTNDRLAPIRRAKQELIQHRSEELAELDLYWKARDMPSLEGALRTYYRKRVQLVPTIVADLSDRSDRRY
jgi:DNA-binding GntR family transcriptional regulator